METQIVTSLFLYNTFMDAQEGRKKEDTSYEYRKREEWKEKSYTRKSDGGERKQKFLIS